MGHRQSHISASPKTPSTSSPLLTRAVSYDDTLTARDLTPTFLKYRRHAHHIENQPRLEWLHRLLTSPNAHDSKNSAFTRAFLEPSSSFASDNTSSCPSCRTKYGYFSDKKKTQCVVCQKIACKRCISEKLVLAHLEESSGPTVRCCHDCAVAVKKWRHEIAVQQKEAESVLFRSYQKVIQLQNQVNVLLSQYKGLVMTFQQLRDHRESASDLNQIDSLLKDCEEKKEKANTSLAALFASFDRITARISSLELDSEATLDEPLRKSLLIYIRLCLQDTLPQYRLLTKVTRG